MRFHHSPFFAVVPLVLLGACGSDTPSQPSVPPATTPPVVAPPTTVATGLIPVGRLSLTVIGFMRGGILQPIPGGNPFPVLLREEDIIQFDCTPRDADGVVIPSNRHSKNVEWEFSSRSLVNNVDYGCIADDTFNPDCRVRAKVRGWFEVYCRLTGVQSNTLHFDTIDR